MNKIKELKRRMSIEFEKLSEKELNFLTGGATATPGSSGTGSGSSDTACTCCDKTRVHCCFKDIKITDPKDSSILSDPGNGNGGSFDNGGGLNI